MNTPATSRVTGPPVMLHASAAPGVAGGVDVSLSQQTAYVRNGNVPQTGTVFGQPTLMAIDSWPARVCTVTWGSQAPHACAPPPKQRRTKNEKVVHPWTLHPCVPLHKVIWLQTLRRPAVGAPPPSARDAPPSTGGPRTPPGKAAGPLATAPPPSSRRPAPAPPGSARPPRSSGDPGWRTHTAGAARAPLGSSRAGGRASAARG